MNEDIKASGNGGAGTLETAAVSHRTMKVQHLIEKLKAMNPNLVVSFRLVGWVATPHGPGEAGEMMYREPRREKRLDAMRKLHPGDIGSVGAHAVISVGQVVRYELTDTLALCAELRAANQHVTRDPEEGDLDAFFAPAKTLVFPRPQAAE